MRLSLIEEKTVRQEETRNGEERHHHVNKRDEESGHRDGEEDPLINKKIAEHKFLSDQSKWLKSLPIPYCLKVERLSMALLLALMHELCYRF